MLRWWIFFESEKSSVIAVAGSASGQCLVVDYQVSLGGGGADIETSSYHLHGHTWSVELDPSSYGGLYMIYPTLQHETELLWKKSKHSGYMLGCGGCV